MEISRWRAKRPHRNRQKKACAPDGAGENAAMPSTHLSLLHYHIIFATKERRPFIALEWRERLHAYLGGVLREMDAIPQCVGGVADHIHILAGLKATHCLADVMRDLKRASSEWVHETIGDRAFAWQEGYGAFTVSASMREGCAALHRTAGGAPPHTHLPGGIHRVPPQERCGVR